MHNSTFYFGPFCIRFLCHLNINTIKIILSGGGRHCWFSDNIAIQLVGQIHHCSVLSLSLECWRKFIFNIILLSNFRYKHFLGEMPLCEYERIREGNIRYLTSPLLKIICNWVSGRGASCLCSLVSIKQERRRGG